ncbi:MAG: Rpn family recombination-promoting nuclease/putative transposase [Coleofasciculus sp. C1-SOL-03]|jgi:predicted transposase/invertase (TIGR01784 family)|uniref:Rpn family recombination-promoting nuclease/putative transposase n=1 Tax=Coleofasciculus sp. C1-SOL-03 TaxID=3069522 RepID=UPI0033040542
MSQTHIRFDWAIKKLLRNKANYGVLAGFLSELLGKPIKIQSILESESNQQTEDDKLSRVDILAENDQGELILIEVQNNTEQDYFHRMLYGTARLITDFLEKGEPYGNVKKVYSVNVVYFSLGQGNDYIYKGILDFRGLHLEDRLGLSINQQNLFNIQDVHEIFPEYYVIKVNNFNDVAKTTLDEWIYFLKKSQIKEEFTAQGLAEAKENLLVDSLSEEERANYLRFMENRRYEISMLQGSRSEGRLEGRLEGLEEGLKEGIEQGKQQEKINIARTLKQRGVDPDTIAQGTGLTIEEIEKL